MNFSLNSPVSNIKIISPAYQKRLLKLGIKTIRDLLYHFPFRYDDFSQIKPIGNLKLNETATIQGEIIEIKNTRTWRKRMFVTEAYVRDSSGVIKAVWFNQPFLTNTLKQGQIVSLSGKVNFDKTLYLSNPAYEKISFASLSPKERSNSLFLGRSRKKLDLRHTGRLVAVYPETQGVSSRWLRYIIGKILPQALPQIKDHLPLVIKRNQGLMDLARAIQQIHFPETKKHAEAARRRLAFDELFLIQTSVLLQKMQWQKQTAPKITFNQPLIKSFVASLPFKLTNAQRKAAWEILRDLEKLKPMNRLLEGDVGSGKTVVAAIAALEVAKNGGLSNVETSKGRQVAFMAPTEILAQQHFKEITKLLNNQNVVIGLLTAHDAVVAKPATNSTKHSRLATDAVGNETALAPASGGDQLPRHNLIEKITKNDFINQVSSGQIQIVIGTHALIQEKVKFKNLALAVVDEQHRFGVNQRAALIRKLTHTNAQTNAEKKLLDDDTIDKIKNSVAAARKKIRFEGKKHIYQQALEKEFSAAGLKFEKKKRLDIILNNKKIGAYQPDFVVENKAIVELTTLPYIDNAKKRQIENCLKIFGYQFGLLINYSSGKEEVISIISDVAKDFPRQSPENRPESAFSPHLLSMTATPIPRTLALTIYGDLDISLLDEMPKGRQEIITKIVAPQDRQKAYNFIRQQVKNRRQVFVICPRIDSSQTNVNQTQSKSETLTSPELNPRQSALLEVKAVKEEFEKLSKIIFPDLRIAMLHGKLKPKEKEKIMTDFKANHIDILVSTSVIEVGIDVPNATVMMIEGADRFGLAQLHQFRGRVGRGEHQSYCLLFTESASKKTNARLKALITCKNGFELAEKDLQIRGPGEFYGARQWGLPDLSMASLSDATLVKSVREEAQKLVQEDPELKKHPLLKEKLKDFQTTAHLE